MITYPVPADSRWAVLQLSTGEIVARNRAWPRTDGGEIVGADPDYVYLQEVATEPPDYDSRFYSLNGVETPDVPNNEIRRTWQTVKRPTAEIVLAAENVEAEKVANLVRMERAVLEHHMAIAVLANVVFASQQPPARFRALIDRIRAEAVKLFQNRDRLNEAVTQIQAGQEPNLDAGWVES